MTQAYTEHFRDFAHPEADEVAQQILHPEHDDSYLRAARHGSRALRLIGGRLLYDGREQTWEFGDPDGQTARMHIYEPEIVIPAMLRHRDVGLFYTYVGEGQALWSAQADIPEEARTGNATSDSLVGLTEALHHTTRLPRFFSYASAWLRAPFRDRQARQEWQTSTDQTKDEIHTHYDLSQDVYVGPHGMLDPKYRQYSSGYLAPEREFAGLEDMQAQKVESLAELLNLDNAKTLLEVGSGWGGLAVALAEMYPDLHVTSLTVSHEEVVRPVNCPSHGACPISWHSASRITASCQRTKNSTASSR